VTMNEVPNSQLPEVPRAPERESNVNTANLLGGEGRDLFNGDPPVLPVLVLGDSIPNQHASCQPAIMNEVPNVPLSDIPRALEEGVNARVANFFVNDESNSIHGDSCVPPVLVMDAPIPSQHTICQTNDGSDESNPKSLKKRGGAKKKRTKEDPNKSGEESPSSLSVSLSNSDDPKEEFNPFSGSTYFR